MYVKKLEIKNIRCFNYLSLNFSSTGDVTNWGLILGDNGLGKTTILRSIAMSLSGTTSLLDEIEGEWLRSGECHGEIRLETEPANSSEKAFSVTTSFKRSSLKAKTEISQTSDPSKDKIPWERFFVCGYGAGRGVIGAEPHSRYSVMDSVYTLFRYDQMLQTSEVVIRRIKDHTKRYEQVLHWIDEILMLPPGSTKLEIGGLTVSGPWGRSVPVGALADGHQATLAWIVDMLGWALLQNKDVFRREISGIVILDEVEQHLHPKWQRKIIPLLRNVFPRIQFIMTTHSPLVAANTGRTTSLDGPKVQLFYLGQEDTDIQLSEVEENLEDLNVTQVLSSEAFGHILPTNYTIEEVLIEASVLAAKDRRTEEEQSRYKQIKEMLKEIMFPKGMTLIERLVEREYYSDLEKKIKDFNRILNKGNK